MLSRGMLSERYFKHQSNKLINKWTLKISDEKIEGEYSKQAYSNDSIGILCIGIYTAVTLIFNSFLCLMLIDYGFTWLYGFQFGSVIIFFLLYCKFHTSPRFITLIKPVCLLVFCLTIEEHEFEPVATFYSSIFKTALFLMTSSQSGSSILNCLVATLVPLMVIVGFYVTMKDKTSGDQNK